VIARGPAASSAATTTAPAAAPTAAMIVAAAFGIASASTAVGTTAAARAAFGQVQIADRFFPGRHVVVTHRDHRWRRFTIAFS
jgi:hypothetical protein